MRCRAYDDATRARQYGVDGERCVMPDAATLRQMLMPPMLLSPTYDLLLFALMVTAPRMLMLSLLRVICCFRRFELFHATRYDCHMLRYVYDERATPRVTLLPRQRCRR